VRLRGAGAGVAAVVLALGVGSGPAVGTAAQAGSRGAARATEIGVTSSTIRIAVVADVDNPLAPGVFAASPAAVQAFATYVNQHGGLAGRKLVVDFIDSHLTDSDARNAIIKACTQDFALVGTAALFLDNVDDMVGCRDQSGAVTGLPDIPIAATQFAQQCAPVSFAIYPSEVDCSTIQQHPQTYRINEGLFRYLVRVSHQHLHGITLYNNDVKAVAVYQLVAARASEAAGITSDGEIALPTTAPQAAYTLLIDQMKRDNSNYAFVTGTFSAAVALRKEATLQGINGPNMVWDCFITCYDRQFLQQGGADVEGEYISNVALPLNETGSNQALANYVKYTGTNKVNALGESAWIAGLLFRDAVQDVVRRGDNNSLTRRALLDALRATTSLNADGMLGTTNIGQRIPSPCYVVMQVKHGRFTRIYPAKPGTFDCRPNNVANLKEDLLAG
jgi:ABC-type branched-subunit amino acid transport system substrate-binding protein